MSAIPADEIKDEWIAKTAANGVEYYYNLKVNY